MSLAGVRRALGSTPRLSLAGWRWREYVVPASVLALLAYFVVLIITRIVFSSPGYDDSWYSSVARNFAAGRGYVTVYGETIRDFDPQVTTGSAVILPAAALYFVFGNHYWAGDMAVALLAIPSLGAVLWVLAARWRLSPVLITLMVTLILLYSNERTSDGQVYRFLFLWSHLMAEIPAGAFVILSALLVSIARSDWRLHSLGGVFIGLAVYSKLYVFFAAPGFILAYAMLLQRERSVLPPIAFAAGALVIAAAFESFRLAELGSVHAYVQNTREVIHFYRTWGDLIGSDSSTLANLSQQLKIGLLVAAPFLIWLVVLMYDRLRAPAHSGVDGEKFTFGMILVVAAVTHFIWWWLINDAGWIRHMVPAFMYAIAGLFVLVTLSRVSLVRYAGLAVVVVLVVPQIGSFRDFTPMLGQEPRLSALASTSSYIRSLDSQNVSFWGCGWWANRDVALVADVRFYDCTDRASVSQHLGNGERLLLVRSEFFNWENSPALAAIASDCDTRAVFRNGAFSVCDAGSFLPPPTK